MTIKDLNPKASQDIANVSIKQGATTKIAILESNNPMQLALAVCTAMTNNNKISFVSGTTTTATLKMK